MLYALLAIGPAVMLANILKNIEGVDVYDHGVNYTRSESFLGVDFKQAQIHHS